MKLIVSVRDINGTDHYININYIIRIEIYAENKNIYKQQYIIYMTDKNNIVVNGYEFQKFLNNIE